MNATRTRPGEAEWPTPAPRAASAGIGAVAGRRCLGSAVLVVAAVLLTPVLVGAGRVLGVEVSLAVQFAVAGVAAAAVLAWGSLDDRRRVELIRLAHHDPLTGLANRRAFRLVVDRALAGRTQGSRAGDRVAFLFVDLDGFKAVNDTHGHDAGDEVLVTVADRLRHAVRDGDLVARLGGDEFAVFCPDCSEGDALEVADRIHIALEAPVPAGGTRTHVSASVGVVAGTPRTDAGGMLARADAAMYRAKAAGKARTELDRAA